MITAGSTISILTGVVLPVFAIVSFQAAAWLYRSLQIPNSAGGMLYAYIGGANRSFCVCGIGKV